MPRTVSSANRFSITSPSGLVTKSRQVASSTCAARSFSQGSGSQERRLDRPRHLRHLGVEAAPRVVLVGAVGQLEERGAGGLALRVLDQQPAVPAVADAGRVRRDRPRRERHVELELGHQPGRHQRDQVRVARDPRGPPHEGLRRDRRAADPVQPLQDQHGESRPGEVGRRHQAVVAGSDDRDVVPPEGGVRGRHGSNLVAVDLSPCAARARCGARNMQRSTIVEIGTDQP